MANKTSNAGELRFTVLATDNVALRLYEGKLEVLLIPAIHEHFPNMEALPGGLITPAETADEAARRHLNEKGGWNVVT
jgi:ADP-ribose pyrophosphatase YjhB (NUDIX family)